ncbi:MAG: hypothetical protein L0312_34085, partial [Acidobacteria bacterium]|nr:hypothetical protein [Acidobacteriota bacterium]
IDLYAERLAALLPAGGRLLNHGIARLRHIDPDAGPFSERYGQITAIRESGAGGTGLLNP